MLRPTTYLTNLFSACSGRGREAVTYCLSKVRRWRSKYAPVFSNMALEMSPSPLTIEEELEKPAHTVIDIMPDIVLTARNSGDEDPDLIIEVDNEIEESENKTPSLALEGIEMKKEDFGAMSGMECISIRSLSDAETVTSSSSSSSDLSTPFANLEDFVEDQPKDKYVRFLMPDGSIEKPMPTERATVILAPIGSNRMSIKKFFKTNEPEPLYFCNKAMVRELKSQAKPSSFERLRGFFGNIICSTDQSAHGPQEKMKMKRQSSWTAAAKSKMKINSTWPFKTKEYTTPMSNEELSVCEYVQAAMSSEESADYEFVQTASI